jgi:hypothetical protein
VMVSLARLNVVGLTLLLFLMLVVVSRVNRLSGLGGEADMV